MEVLTAVAITWTDLTARELRVAASKAKDAKGLAERKAGLGELTVANRTLETRIYVDRLRMPGRTIEAVFEALIRNP